jgi:hypothetical protein
MIKTNEIIGSNNLLIRTSSGEKTILNLERYHSILSWDGKSIVESDIKDVDVEIVNHLYEIRTATKKVVISNNQGLFTEKGKLNPAHIIPNKTIAKILDNNTVKYEKILSVKKLEGSFLAYNIIGSTYRNYILNDFILHNFDIEDYVAVKMIGANNFDIPFNTVPWSDCGTTARAAFDAHAKAFSEYVLASAANSIRADDTTTIATWEIYLDDYTECFKEALTHSKIFWNSVAIPDDQISGNQTNSAPRFTPFITYDMDYNSTMIPIQMSRPNLTVENFTINYTGLSFQTSYWENHKVAMKAYLASVKRFMALSSGFYAGEYDYPGVYPAYGYTTPSSPTP